MARIGQREEILWLKATQISQIVNGLKHLADNEIKCSHRIQTGKRRAGLLHPTVRVIDVLEFPIIFA